MQKGIYEVISDVKIRREPHIVEGTTTNSVGLLKVGTQRGIYDTIVQSDNSTGADCPARTLLALRYGFVYRA